MRKFTLTLLGILLGHFALAQSYSTGTVSFFSGGPTLAYSGKIDVNSSTVTVTLIGPSTSWLGIAFNTLSMDDDSDVVVFNGTTVSDRHFDGFGNTPVLDAQQNWSLVSNNEAGGVRTVVISRSRVASESGDYTFPLTASPLNIAFARSIGSTTFQYHGSGNCNATVVNFTLGNEEFNIDSFKIYPNPAKNHVTVELPAPLSEANVVLYDVSGRKVLETKVTLENSQLETSALLAGTYFMSIKTSEGVGTKSLVIN